MRRSELSPAAGSETNLFDTDTPAVVLKLDPNVFHHGGLGVIRSLGRAGIDVYGVHEDRLAPAANSRYLRGRWYWTADASRAERVIAGLEQIASRLDRPAVLIPTDDAGAILLSQHGDALRKWFLFPAPPRDLPRQLAGKYSLHELCKQWGFPHVRAALPTSFAEAQLFAEEVGLPLVAKLARPWQSGAIRSTTIVDSIAQLAELYRLAPADGLMLQEYIPGGPGRDWFFHGYCDGKSVCEPAFTGVKERSYPPHSGLTSFGRAVANPVLREQVCELLSKIGYQGIMDLDIRFDARDGQYKLLDFNPRIGAQFRIFQNAAGIDVARAAHLDLTGRPLPSGLAMADRRFFVENYDTLAAIGYMRRGELSLRSWLATVRGVNEAAWFARDDLLPFGLMCLRMAWRAVERPFGGRRFAPQRSPRFRPGRGASSHRLGAHRVAVPAVNMRSDVPSRSAGLAKEETES